MFDYGNDGGCQTAAVFACVESSLKHEFGYDYIKKWYEYGDRVYGGRIEHINRVINFFNAFGIEYGDSRIYPDVITRLQPVKGECTFENFWNLQDSFEGIVIALRGRSSFFADKSGMLYESIQLPASAGHAMRINGRIMYKGERALLFQNSWGSKWGHGGFGIVPESKFHLLKFTTCYAFNIRIQSVR